MTAPSSSFIPLAPLLQALIRFDTTNPPGNESACVSYVNALLQDAGCVTQIVSKSPERPNLIARLSGARAAPPLLLYGHLDVVPAADQPWMHPPFAGQVADGCLWGRGALDMKGGIAMMLAAFLRAKAENLPLPGDVILALVSDEEAGGVFGARFLVEEHSHLFQGVRYAIGEFGGFSMEMSGRRFYPIMVAEKQVCRLELTVRGQGGHGSLTSRDRALARLGQVLTRLDRGRLPVHITPASRMMLQSISSHLPFPRNLALRLLLCPPLSGFLSGLMGPAGNRLEPLLRNTVNATLVRGGEKVNVVPTQATLTLDGRLLPGCTPDDLLAELKPILGGLAEVRVLQHSPGPAHLDMGLFDTLAGIIREADPGGVAAPMLLPATTDARFFARLGIQTYGFLPMRLEPGLDFLGTVHGPDERIPIAALDFGAEAIYQLLGKFNQWQAVSTQTRMLPKGR